MGKNCSKLILYGDNYLSKIYIVFCLKPILYQRGL